MATCEHAPLVMPEHEVAPEQPGGESLGVRSPEDPAESDGRGHRVEVAREDVLASVEMRPA
jgi:hypothetical protein